MVTSVRYPLPTLCICLVEFDDIGGMFQFREDVVLDVLFGHTAVRPGDADRPRNLVVFEDRNGDTAKTPDSLLDVVGDALGANLLEFVLEQVAIGDRVRGLLGEPVSIDDFGPSFGGEVSEYRLSQCGRMEVDTLAGVGVDVHRVVALLAEEKDSAATLLDEEIDQLARLRGDRLEFRLGDVEQFPLLPGERAQIEQLQAEFVRLIVFQT